MSLSFSLQVSFSLCLFVSLLLYPSLCSSSPSFSQQRFALPELPQASHSSRSPWPTLQDRLTDSSRSSHQSHRKPFKIVSPKPLQALSRGYEWAGFSKSDLGCGYLIGFMVVGMYWLKALAYGCGLIDLVVGCCGLCRGLKLCGGWFFFFFNAIECHG